MRYSWLISLLLFSGFAMAEEFEVDESCAFVKIKAHEDVKELVHNFVRKDAEGLFLQADPWFESAVDCPGHEPAPDSYSVIKGYDIKPVDSTDKSAKFDVTYQVVGAMAYKMDTEQKYVIEFEPAKKPGAVKRTMEAVNTPYGWRLTGEMMNPHVLATALLKRDDLSPKSRAALAKFIPPPPAPKPSPTKAPVKKATEPAKKAKK